MFSNASRGNDCRIYRWAFLLRCRNCSSDCASEVMLRPHVRLPGAWAWLGHHWWREIAIAPRDTLEVGRVSSRRGGHGQWWLGLCWGAPGASRRQDVLKPRFPPKIRPTKFNYPIAVYGKSATIPLSLPAIALRTAIRTSRNSRPDCHREYVSRDTFDLSYHRYTGERLCIFQRVSLAETLEVIEATPHFQPC
jgi:hypothetical protein